MARTLKNNGYTNVRILHGGYDAWKAAKGPVDEKATQPPSQATAQPTKPK